MYLTKPAQAMELRRLSQGGLKWTRGDESVSEGSAERPWGVAALGIFFGLGAGAGFVACVSLVTPGGLLEPMWRLNPRAQEALERAGPAGPTLMSLVSVACGYAAVGLWSGKPWGYRSAVALLIVNLLGDIVNVFFGMEPRAIVGIPIVAALLAFLATRHVRSYFGARTPRDARP
jgi:hypothetical protein